MRARVAIISACMLIAWSRAQAQEAQILDTVIEGVIIQMAQQYYASRMFNPANTNLDKGATNTWVGFQPQTDCGSDGNFISTAPSSYNVTLPCVPDNRPGWEPFGAGLQIMTGLTAEECNMKAQLGGLVIGHTIVPALQTINPPSGVPFGFLDPSGAPLLAAAGVCSGSGEQRANYIGELLGVYPTIIAVNLITVTQCAYLVNMSSFYSCGPYNSGPP